MFSTTRIIWIVVTFFFIAWCYYYFFQKVCESLPDDFFKGSLSPEQRSDEKGFIYQYWQEIDGRWNRCSTRFENDGHF
jgi:hypothetical protein